MYQGGWKPNQRCLWERGVINKQCRGEKYLNLGPSQQTIVVSNEHPCLFIGDIFYLPQVVVCSAIQSILGPTDTAKEKGNSYMW